MLSIVIKGMGGGTLLATDGLGYTGSDPVFYTVGLLRVQGGVLSLADTGIPVKKRRAVLECQ